MIFTIKSLFTDSPTSSGNIYPIDCLNQICKQINSAVQKPTIQQINSAERDKKKIPAYEPIPSQVMAKITSAVVEGNSLDVICEIKPGRNGTKLKGLLETVGIEHLEFVPVGYGNTRKTEIGNVVFNYTLKYVSVEPKQ